jgi:cell division inhibitor SepF
MEMGIMDKLKKYLDGTEGEFDEVTMEDTDDLLDDGYVRQTARESFDDHTETGVNLSVQSAKRNIVSIDSHPGLSPHIALKKVDNNQDALEAARLFKEGKVIVVNMETCTNNPQRIIDFFSGVAFARDGLFKKVGGQVYVLAQSKKDISGEIFDERVSAPSYDN